MSEVEFDLQVKIENLEHCSETIVRMIVSTGDEIIKLVNSHIRCFLDQINCIQTLNVAEIWNSLRSDRQLYTTLRCTAI
jgi:hypothetical protein